MEWKTTHEPYFDFSDYKVSEVFEYLDALKFNDGVVSDTVFRNFGFNMTIYYFECGDDIKQVKKLNNIKKSFTGYDPAEWLNVCPYFIILAN